MDLFCDVCNVHFNGISPYRDHMNSEKHKKKDNNPVNVSHMQISLDQYIKPRGIEYECIKCNTTLNSYQQAQSHVSGRKHQTTPYNNSKSSAIMEKTSKMPDKFDKNSELIFSFHDITIKSDLSDLKVININDPFSF